MAKKITVAIRKGGAGKSTTAANLATALTLKGKRVLLVDLDPQANATLAVGIDPLSLTKNINHLFTRIDVQPASIIVRSPAGLDVLPSHEELSDTENGMKATQVGILKPLLASLDDAYDFIVIDTPPSESHLTTSALVATDEVLIPLEAHFLALKGLAQSLDQVEQVRIGLNPAIKIAGILPTRVNARTNISRIVLEEAKKTYSYLLYPIQVDFSVRHIEASLAGQPIVLYEPTHQGALAYMKLAETFL